MQIQVNSDSSVTVDAELTELVEASVNKGLARFAEQISRVEVHLSDVNGDKSGAQDKRCLMEARPAGADPVVVTDEAPTVDVAVRGATRKMERLFSHRAGRLEAKRH